MQAKAPKGSMAIEFRVELYNLTARGRAVGNGYMVVRFVDGCRANTIKQFAGNEQAARNFCRYLNEGFSVRRV